MLQRKSSFYGFVFWREVRKREREKQLMETWHGVLDVYPTVQADWIDLANIAHIHQIKGFVRSKI